MLSIADIPFKIFHFTGMICTLLINDKEYKFTTYNNAKILKYETDNGLIDIKLRKGKYNLNIESKYDDGLLLSAPVKGRMEKDIFESICSNIKVELKKENTVFFSDTSSNCGLEVVMQEL